jgi:VIT1/CCC1 family predicted Fe2+/Mn2+ transporter
MFALLRVVAILVALAVVGFAIAYFRTGDRKYLRRSQRTFLWGLVAAFVFFAVMFIQRLY